MANHLRHINTEVVKTLKEVEIDWSKCSDQLDLARQSKGSYPLFRVLGYTEQLLLIKGLTRSIHRVFIQASDSGEYEKLGWVLRADASVCMLCAASFQTETSLFSIFDWSNSTPQKLNCHACGNVVCNNCVEEAVVSEIHSEGPVAVCKQCCFGQEEVSMVPSPALPPSYKLHQKLLTETSVHKKSSTVSAAAVSGGGERDDQDMPRMWKYGPVALHPTTPVFSITAYAKQNPGITQCPTYYINFCSSVHVPYNLHPECTLLNAALTKKGQELMLTVSERGVCSSGSGVVVYDVTLHPTVYAKCSEDSSGGLKEKVCSEVLRSIVRLGLESEFTIFTYNTINTNTTITTTNTTINNSSVYKHRLYTIAERTQRASDVEHYHRNDNKVHVLHTDTNIGVSNTATSNKPSSPNSVRFAPINTTTTSTTNNTTSFDSIAHNTPSSDIIFAPIPSVSAFFHLEQIHVQYTHLQRPAGNHLKRWQKYSEITQLSDGTLYIPSNKRVRKSNVVVDIPVPVLVLCGTTSGVDKYNQPLVSYTMNIVPHNGFVINTTRVYNGMIESVLVHVLHSVYVDFMINTGLLSAELDECDPLLLLSKRAYKVKNSTSGVYGSDSSSVSRAYNVLVGSSYIDGVKTDLTGRRIVAPERISKILRSVNTTFEEHLNLHKYTLSGVTARPLTAAAALSAYTYDRQAHHDATDYTSHRTHTNRSNSSPSGILHTTNTTRHVRHSSGGSVISDLSDSRSGSIDYTNFPAATLTTSPPNTNAGGGANSNVSTNTTTKLGKKLRHFFPSNNSMGSAPGVNTGIADRDSHAHNSHTTQNTSDGHDPHHYTANRPSPVDTLRSGSSSDSRSHSSSNEHMHTINTTNTNPASPSITLHGARTPLGRAASFRVPVSPTIAEYNHTNNNSNNSNTNSGNNSNGKPPSSRGKSINLLAFSLLGGSNTNSGSGENINSTTHRVNSNNNSASGSPHHTPRVSPTATPLGTPLGTPRGTPPQSPRSRANSTGSGGNTSLQGATNSGLSKFIPPPLLHRISLSSTGSHSSPPTPTTPYTAAPVKRANTATIPGDKMVTLEMLHYEVHSSVNRAVAEGINKQSTKEPKLLFGWQIRVHDHINNTHGGVYVVTCVARKNVVGNYEFRLTSVSGDVWVKLQRGGEGEGLAFTAVRKVMVADE